jgi:hypothetical protein
MDLFGIGGALLGGLLGGKDGQQSQTSTKQPYGPATGWLDSNIADGQALQNYYKQNPFSQAQQNAYGNSQALSDSFRSVMPGLNKQMSSTQYFDRSNPLARPQSFNFTGGDTSQASTVSQPQSVNNGANILPNPWASIPQQSPQAAPPQYRAPVMQDRGGSDYATYSNGDTTNNNLQNLGGALQNLGLGTIGQAVSDYGFQQTPNYNMSLADQYESYGMGRAQAEAMASMSGGGSANGYGSTNSDMHGGDDGGQGF